MGDTGPLVLSHLYMVVSDLPTSRAFYADVVGLELLLDEGEYLRWGLGSIMIGMEQAKHGSVGAPGIEFELRVGDVDAVYTTMVARAVEFSGPPADMPWGARHAFFNDPDSYAWSIWIAPEV